MVFGLFKKQKNPNGKYKRLYYSIAGVHSQRVFDIAQQGDQQGKLILWDGKAKDHQKFTIIQDGPQYYIKCKLNDQYLTVDGPQNGARFHLEPLQKGNINQRFRIDEQEGKKDHVLYTGHGKVVDACQDGKKNGTIIHQWDYTGNKNQLWNFCDPKDITSSSSDNA